MVMRKKKICLMYNHFQLQDGVNRSAMAIANELVKRDDVDVTLIPLYRFDNECYKYLDKKVRVKRLFGFYFQGLTKIVRLLPAKWLYRWAINDKYDVNIAFQFGHSLRIIAAGVHYSHVSIGWMHGYDEGLVLKEYYEKMNKLVCVSKSNSIRLAHDLNKSVVVDYNYNPIDEKYICQQGREHINIERPQGILFVTVGRMSPEKGFERLLNCVKRLKNDGYNFCLWLIGDGALLDSLKLQASTLDIDDVVTFHGKQQNPHAFTSKADVFVCSSFVEGYSTACTEAIILNVPVITTNVSGAEEIIEAAECGEIFESTDEAIYLAMKRILDNPTLVQDWKNKLMKTKVNFYTEKRFCRFLDIVGLK